MTSVDPSTAMPCSASIVVYLNPGRTSRLNGIVHATRYTAGQLLSPLRWTPLVGGWAKGKDAC